MAMLREIPHLPLKTEDAGTVSKRKAFSHLQSSHLLAGRCNVSRCLDDALPPVVMLVEVGTELLKHGHERRIWLLLISHEVMILSFPTHNNMIERRG